MNSKDAIRAALDESLASGKYVQLFLDNLIDLAINQEISPEVIFREIRVLEGKKESLLGNLDVECCQVWFGGHEFQLNRSPSATKGSSEFTGRWLKGLHHKHYYVHQSDFTALNVKNQHRKYPLSQPLAAMITRIAEGGLTGEWIVFKKINGINTYLCLAKHTDGDKTIHDRLIENGVTLD